MKKRYILAGVMIVLAVCSATMAIMSSNNLKTKQEATVSPIVVASTTQNDTFKNNLQAKLDNKSSRASDFGSMFDNVRVSGYHDYTFSPEIVSGGLTFDGRYYVAVVNTHRDGQDTYYTVSGQSDVNGNISTITVSEDNQQWNIFYLS